MRRRWEFNENAVFSLQIGWFVVGFVSMVTALLLSGPRYHRHFTLAVAITLGIWLGPFIVAGAIWLLKWWPRHGWFVRRVTEPVVEDLRTQAKSH